MNGCISFIVITLFLLGVVLIKFVCVVFVFCGVHVVGSLVLKFPLLTRLVGGIGLKINKWIERCN